MKKKSNMETIGTISPTQIANPPRPGRNCTVCDRRCPKEGDIVARIAYPRVHFVCQRCASMFPELMKPEENEVNAKQLVPGGAVISLQEPYAWLVVKGFKNVENRKQHRKFSGRVFIHSSQAFADRYEDIEHKLAVHHGILIPERDILEMQQGRLVGVAEFEPMQAEMSNKWKIRNQWAFPIKWAFPFYPTDIVRGQLGIWNLGNDNFPIKLYEHS